MAKRTVELQIIVDDKGTTKKLKVDADQLDAALAKTGKQQKNFRKQQRGVNQTAQSGSKNFANLTGGIMSSGGLVAAYATLAAQIFAVTAAFGFLREAGQFAQLQQGQVAYAATFGTSIRSLTQNIIDATDAQINFRDAAQAAAIGTAAGLNADQLTRLGLAAKQTSLILGRDVTDSFNRLIRGVTKAEPELLDELGIILRLEKATNDYGRAIGKSAKDLTAFERSQAVANDTLAQVEGKFGVIGAEAQVQANEFAKLQKVFNDLLDSLRLISVELAGPIARLLQDFPALIGLAFAPFAAQVAGAALPQLTNLGSKLESLTSTAQTMHEELTDQQDQFALAAARAADPKKAEAALNKRSKAVFAAINKEEKLRSNSVLKNLQEGKRLSNTQINRLRAQLNKESGLYANFNKKRKADLIKLLREMEIQNKVTAGKMARDMGAATNSIKVRLTSMGVAGSKAFVKLGAAAATAGRFIAGAFSILSIVSTIALLGSMLFAFMRTKEEVDKADIAMQTFSRTLGNVNDEFASFVEKQEQSNKEFEKGKEAIAAFGARLKNVDTEQFVNALDTEVFQNAALGIQQFTDAQGKAAGADRKRIEMLTALTTANENLLKQNKLSGKALADHLEEQAELEELLGKSKLGFFDFVIGSDKASEAAKRQAQLLKDNLEFLQQTENAYLKNIPAIQQFVGILEGFNKTGKVAAETLSTTTNEIINIGDAASQLGKQSLDNIADFGKALSNFMPDDPLDSLVRGFNKEIELLAVVEGKTKQQIALDERRKVIIQAQLELTKRLVAQKNEEERVTNAIAIAEKRASIGVTKSLKNQIKVDFDILKQKAKVIKAEQEIKNIVDAHAQGSQRLRDHRAELIKLAPKELAELEKIEGAKDRAIDKNVRIIGLAEANLAVLERQKNEILAIGDAMLQAFETGLQGELSKILKGQENDLIQAIKNVGKSIGNAVADVLSKQVTEDIMQALLGIKSPQIQMKEAIENAFIASNAVTKQAIVDASAEGAESYKAAIITASGGTYNSTLSGSTNTSVPSGGISAAAGADPTVTAFQNLANLVKKPFNFLFGSGGTDDGTFGGHEKDAPIEDAGVKSPKVMQGVFTDFIQNFKGIFEQNTVGGFLGQLALTFRSGIGSFADLFTSILGGIGGMLGGGGGFLSALIPGLRTGGLTKNYSTGGIARGPQSGFPAILHGNEAVVPLPDGNKIPVDLGAGAGGVNNVSVNVNIASDGQATTEMTGDRAGGLGKAVAVAVQEELQRQKRPGGILSPFGAA